MLRRRGWGRTDVCIGTTTLVVALVAVTVPAHRLLGVRRVAAISASGTASTTPIPAGMAQSDRWSQHQVELRASRAERRRALEALEAQRRALRARARAIAAERAQAAEKAAVVAQARAATSAAWSGDSWAWAHQPFAEHVQYCESGDNPRAVDPSGQHFGEWQFLLSTWQSVGGTGNPIDASLAEQDYRAWLLWKRDGWGQWQCASM